jgi:hypothetical protein
VLMLLILSISPKHFSQTNFPINKTNDKGKKIGFWLIYLNDRLVPIKDSINYTYKAYNFYYLGTDQSYFSEWKKIKKTSQLDLKGAGKQPLLEGTFSFYDKNNKLSIRQSYKGGFPTLLEVFAYNRQGKIKYYETWTYSQALDDQLGSYAYRKFSADSVLLASTFFRRENNDWLFSDKEKY